MALFLSSFVNRIDKKGRVSVPASFRSALAGESAQGSTQSSAQGFAAFPSYRFSAIEACGLGRMRQLVEGVDRLETFSQEQFDFAATLFADADVLHFDSEGRVLLPAALLEHAQVTELVAFAGCGSTFQIWNPEAFKAHQVESRERLKRQNLTLGRILPEAAKRGAGA
jgi:MraZ protein